LGGWNLRSLRVGSFWQPDHRRQLDPVEDMSSRTGQPPNLGRRSGFDTDADTGLGWELPAYSSLTGGNMLG
jgi:hypothetical protein